MRILGNAVLCSFIEMTLMLGAVETAAAGHEIVGYLIAALLVMFAFAEGRYVGKRREATG